MSLVFEKFPDGETFPVLVDERGCPDLWVNMYLAVEMRPNCSFHTLRNSARSLDHLRAFERVAKRDFAKEFAEANFLEPADVKDLRDHCWLRWRVHDEFVAARKKASRRADPFVAVAPAVPPRVGAAYASARMGDIQRFLIFVAETVLRRRLHEAPIRAAIDRMKTRLEAARPAVGKSGQNDDPFMSAPEPQVFLRAIGLADPANPANPWRSIVRKRNSLMFKILIATGMRLGELLSLRTDSRHLDLSSDHPEIRIRRVHSDKDPLDPRRTPPGQKTTERTLLITPALASEIEDYILTDRRDALPARKHNFLFVNHRRGAGWGAPVSYSGWGTLIGALQRTDAALYEEVRAHGFRHTFAYLFNKRIDEHNAKAGANPEPGFTVIDNKNREKVLMDVMGWTDPGSAEPYLRRYIKEVVDRVRLEQMEELSKFIYVPGCEVTA
ncbi:MAG: site-specific integrase [Candidatus Thiodiazotropha endolucinida]|nr:site-specific integrase [Candidatus Thiodiazotropha sp. (ex Lucina pensylvanica)]MCG8022964.1 site-specific integrase [Candidatus Thiodiazotropha endolucinida]